MSAGSANGHRLHLAVIPQNQVLPLDNGARIRNFHLFRALAARHRVSLLLTQSPPEAQLAELAAAGMEPIRLPKPLARGRAYRSYIGSLARRAPVNFAVQTNPAVRRWLPTHADEIDAVIDRLDRPDAERAARYRPSAGGGHAQHRVGAARLGAVAPAASAPRLRRRLIGAGTAAWERRVLRASARVYVCSADEEADLHAAGIDRVIVVPKAWTSRIQPARASRRGPVLFPGDLATVRTSGRALDRPRDRPGAPSSRGILPDRHRGRYASDDLRARWLRRSVEVVSRGGHAENARQGLRGPRLAAEAGVAPG